MRDAFTDALLDVPPGPLIPFRSLHKELPWVPKKHPCQYERWRSRGLRGHRLKALRFGGTWCTCEAWLIEFLNALSGKSSSPPRSEAGRRVARRSAAVLRDLEEAGI